MYQFLYGRWELSFSIRILKKQTNPHLKYQYKCSFCWSNCFVHPFLWNFDSGNSKNLYLFSFKSRYANAYRKHQLQAFGFNHILMKQLSNCYRLFHQPFQKGWSTVLIPSDKAARIFQSCFILAVTAQCRANLGLPAPLSLCVVEPLAEHTAP